MLVSDDALNDHAVICNNHNSSWKRFSQVGVHIRILIQKRLNIATSVEDIWKDTIVTLLSLIDETKIGCEYKKKRIQQNERER
jgi:hypothetical protein